MTWQCLAAAPIYRSMKTAAYYGLLILDVSDPALPAQLCRYKTPHYAKGMVKDTFAYVAASDSGLR